MTLLVRLRFNTISCLNISGLLRRAVNMQTHFLPIFPRNVILITLNAQYFALDRFSI